MASDQTTTQVPTTQHDDEIDHTFHTNIVAMFHTCKAALEHMQPGAAIVNYS